MWNHTPSSGQGYVSSRLRTDQREIDIHTLKCIERKDARTQCCVQGWEMEHPQGRNTSTTEKKNLVKPCWAFLCALQGWMAEWDSQMKWKWQGSITCKGCLQLPRGPPWHGQPTSVLSYETRRPLSHLKTTSSLKLSGWKISSLPGVTWTFQSHS